MKDSKRWVRFLIQETKRNLNSYEPRPVLMDVEYLTLEEVLFIHEAVMRQYDEPENGGILHGEQLKTAVERPKMVAFGVEVHPNIWHKAAALFQSIVQGHVFRNGNKRTGFVCMMAFLDRNGFYAAIPIEVAEELTVAVAEDPSFKGDEGVRILAAVLCQIFEKG
jgi:death-on-curing protein